MKKAKRGSRIGDEIAEGLKDAGADADTEPSAGDLGRGDVILAKGGRAMVLTPVQALRVIEALIDWETDTQRRPKRIEI